MPRTIGGIISGEHPKATLHECSTIYGLEDLYMMLEVTAVDAHNLKVIRDAAAKREEH